MAGKNIKYLTGERKYAQENYRRDDFGGDSNDETKKKNHHRRGSKNKNRYTNRQTIDYRVSWVGAEKRVFIFGDIRPMERWVERCQYGLTDGGGQLFRHHRFFQIIRRINQFTVFVVFITQSIKEKFSHIRLLVPEDVQQIQSTVCVGHM